jgi:protein-L-isoaspartate(D-aspartate) O-methyltransferase
MAVVRFIRALSGAGLLVVPLAMLTCTGPAEIRGASSDEYDRARARMVDEQIRARDITDPRVLEAMGRVPREQFVPALNRGSAYADHPLSIGYGQTISQPYIVAWMTEALRVTPRSRVLEIGTGSGYQAAVLAELAGEVYTIEIVEPLARSAADTLAALGYRNVEVRHGDGYKGWPEKAPFDGIIVTAAPDHVPQPLVDQLKVGGRMVIPVGGQRELQQMTVISKTSSGIISRETIPVRFVPLVRP